MSEKRDAMVRVASVHYIAAFSALAAAMVLADAVDLSSARLVGRIPAGPVAYTALAAFEIFLFIDTVKRILGIARGD